MPTLILKENESGKDIYVTVLNYNSDEGLLLNGAPRPDGKPWSCWDDLLGEDVDFPTASDYLNAQEISDLEKRIQFYKDAATHMDECVKMKIAYTPRDYRSYFTTPTAPNWPELQVRILQSKVNKYDIVETTITNMKTNECCVIVPPINEPGNEYLIQAISELTGVDKKYRDKGIEAYKSFPPKQAKVDPNSIQRFYFSKGNTYAEPRIYLQFYGGVYDDAYYESDNRTIDINNQLLDRLWQQFHADQMIIEASLSMTPNSNAAATALQPSTASSAAPVRQLTLEESQAVINSVSGIAPSQSTVPPPNVNCYYSNDRKIRVFADTESKSKPVYSIENYDDINGAWKSCEIGSNTKVDDFVGRVWDKKVTPEDLDKKRNYNPFRFWGNSRTHAFKAKSISGYRGLSGDALKRAILINMKDQIEKATNIEALNKLESKIKNQDQYNTLATAQGITSTIFNLKTDSLVALEAMFDKKRCALLAQVQRPFL
jgi:hypothetical protein